MENRLNKINKMISLLKTDENEINKNKNIIIDKLKKKYKILKYYDYIETQNVKLGDILKYNDLELNKLSICGLVVHIYYIDEYNKKQISRFLLFNIYKNIFWVISPKKYYLFRSEKSGRFKNTFNDYLNDIILEDNINKYKQILDDEQIRK
jgi:hypothetical protein